MFLEEFCFGSLGLDVVFGILFGSFLGGLRFGREGKGFFRLVFCERV